MGCDLEGSAVNRHTPDGVLDTIVQVPAKRVTSCTFAGPAEDVLVVTAAQTDDGTGGGLFTVEPGTIGAPGTRFGPT